MVIRVYEAAGNVIETSSKSGKPCLPLPGDKMQLVQAERMRPSYRRAKTGSARVYRVIAITG